MTLHVDVLKGEQRPPPRRGRVQGAGPGPARRRWRWTARPRCRAPRACSEPMPEVVIVPTGTANIASVMAAFRRLGAEPRVSESAGRGRARRRTSCCRASARSARRWRGWSSTGWTGRCASGSRRTGRRSRICVGHQLLFETSDESPGVRGLGRRRRAMSAASPTMSACRSSAGTRCDAGEDARLLEGGYAYFANSYRATEAPGWTVAQADPWRPVRGGHGARQRHRLPVPPRALRRLRRGAAGALPGAAADADLAHHPLPRREPRPRGQGRALPGPARRRRPGRAGAALPGHRARDEIVILDVSATPEGRGHQHETVRRVREVLSIPLTVGGGVRAVEDAWHLLEAGADKVSVNTAAVERPELLSEHRRAVRPAVLRGRDRRRLARRPRSRCWSRAGARAPASTRSSGRARPSGAGRARSC